MPGQKKDGFTLVEVLVAMVLAAIVSIAIGLQLSYSTAMVSENKYTSRAVVVAQNALEDLRTVSYEDITGGSTTVTWDGVPFTAVWTVNEQQGMKDIYVTVSWESKGQTKTYAVETTFTDVE